MDEPVTDRLPAPGSAGFTLIELLVVIAVVSVLSLGAVMALGRDTGRKGDAARFRQGFELQRDLAIQGREMRGIRIGARRMQAMTWDGGGPEGTGQWRAVGGPVRWTRPAAFSARDRIPPGAPQIVFLPVGRSSAFSLRFEDGTRCESDGWAGLTCG